MKYQLGRANKLMICINLILFIVFIAMGANGLGKLNGLAGSGYEALTDVGSGIIGLFALVVAICFLLMIFFGCFTVCCYNYCCCCLVLWVPISFVFTIILFALGAIIGKYRSMLSDVVCPAATEIIEPAYSAMIDGYMCSELCPCLEQDLVDGGYRDSDFDYYAPAESASLYLGCKDEEDYDCRLPEGNNPFTSVADNDAKAEYDLVTSLIIAAMEVDDPPAVKNMKECYATLSSNNDDFTSDMSPAEKEEWEKVQAELWDFLTDIEESYNCGGFCYTPFFAITTDISEGRPEKECLDSIFKATFSSAGAISAVGGIFLLITFLLSLSLCGGMPDKSGENDVDPVEKVQN